METPASSSEPRPVLPRYRRDPARTHPPVLPSHRGIEVTGSLPECVGEIWQAHSDHRFDPHGAASGFRWSARGPADNTGEDGLLTVLRGSTRTRRGRAPTSTTP